MLARLWQWILGWFRDPPERLDHDLADGRPYIKRHWREAHPHNLKVKHIPLMESGESYRYMRDEKRQIRRKLAKGGKK